MEQNRYQSILDANSTLDGEIRGHKLLDISEAKKHDEQRVGIPRLTGGTISRDKVKEAFELLDSGGDVVGRAAGAASASGMIATEGFDDGIDGVDHGIDHEIGDDAEASAYQASWEQGDDSGAQLEGDGCEDCWAAFEKARELLPLESREGTFQ